MALRNYRPTRHFDEFRENEVVEADAKDPRIAALVSIGYLEEAPEDTEPGDVVSATLTPEEQRAAGLLGAEGDDDGPGDEGEAGAGSAPRARRRRGAGGAARSGDDTAGTE